MEFEQITKRLEWLDEQQRKNKTAVSAVEERLASLEGSVNALTKQIKALSKEISEIGPAAERANQFDAMLTKQRTDMTKLMEGIEKRAERREREAAKLHHAEFEGINKAIAKLDASTIKAEDLNKKFKERSIEEQRLSLAVQDMGQKVETVVKTIEPIMPAQKTLEDARRQDVKRVADLQGELASIRKRADEARDKVIIYGDSIRNLENRMGELLATESERKEAQTAFLEQQAMSQVDRDRAWKDWQLKYDAFKKQAENMDIQVAALDDSIRAAKRAQDAYTELNQKLERRIAEISEMQRLAEDRVRQEWVAFKADEQKRWTGHSLSQEESMRDLRKDMDKVEERITLLDDAAQTLQDQVHQTTDTTEKQLQELMNVANEWLTTYERIMGHGKKTKKTTAK
ncbi:MAG: hypothetical protein HYX49_05335 [Chloroflexi bacterium]|nr:hypothetical protein [Chloroflexota bacterium]